MTFGTVAESKGSRLSTLPSPTGNRPGKSVKSPSHRVVEEHPQKFAIARRPFRQFIGSRRIRMDDETGIMSMMNERSDRDV